jgi:general secretion pathway protein C
MLRSPIEEVGPLRYRIVRGAFGRLVERDSLEFHPGRNVFAIRDGVMLGPKLYGVRPGSLPARLGFESGDLVKRVNGVALTSRDRVLELCTWLPKARRIRVDLTRQGARLQIVYEIVD